MIEICVDNYEDALTACLAGAERLELCARLDQNGLTPDMKTIEKVLSIDRCPPVRVMIRCRPGNFIYNDNEVLSMKKHCQKIAQLPIEGIVFGALTTTNEVDIKVCSDVFSYFQNKKNTFHRAFDYVADQLIGINQIIDLDIETILTSGKPGKAIDHIECLSQLVKHAHNRIEIMVGGGVFPDQRPIFWNIGVEALHASVYHPQLTPFEKITALVQSSS